MSFMGFVGAGSGGGGGGSPPGGLSGQVQYNNSGVFDGMAGTTWDKVNDTLTISSGTVTTSSPILNLSQTWNNAAVAFQAFRINITPTASLNTQNNAFFQFQVSGTDSILFNTASQLILKNASNPLLQLDGSAFGSANFLLDAEGGATFAGNITNNPIGFYTNNGTTIAAFREGSSPLQLTLNSGAALSWSSGSAQGAALSAIDLYLFRDAANVLAQRSGISPTTAQAFRIYNTFTNSTSYERGTFDWAQTANVLTIGTEKGSVGGTSRDIRIICGGTEIAHVSDGSGVVTDLFQIGWNGITPTVQGDQFSIASTNNSIFSGYRWANSLNGATITLCHTRQGTIGGSAVALTVGDLCGQLVFNGDDGVSGMLFTAATISGRVDAAVSAGIVPGRLVFKVTNSAGTFFETGRIDSNGNFLVGTSAISTTATNGFLYIPTCAGTPTGTPTAYSGLVPMVYDSTNNKFYIYNTAWKQVLLT